MKYLKTNSLLLIVSLLIASLITLNSCDKNSNENQLTTDNNLETAGYLWVANLFVLSDIDEETTEDTYKSAETISTFDCRTLTIQENDNGEFWPRNYTIDYGEIGCEGFNGVLRSGKINVSITDFWKNTDSKRTITFEDFYQNDIKLEGIKTITNTGVNENDNLSWQKLIDANVINIDEQSMSWKSERISEMTAGSETFIFADDEYSVTGTSTGVNYDGVNFTMEVTSPLLYKSGCFWPLNGIIVISINGESDITIDYGNGECDNIATSTVNGITTTITL